MEAHSLGPPPCCAEQSRKASLLIHYRRALNKIPNATNLHISVAAPPSEQTPELIFPGVARRVRANAIAESALWPAPVAFDPRSGRKVELGHALSIASPGPPYQS